MIPRDLRIPKGTESCRHADMSGGARPTSWSSSPPWLSLRASVPLCLRACLFIVLVAGPYLPAALATFETKLTAADGAARDEFGNSVAISGDTMVIGAPRDDDWRGSAYIFVRSASDWVQKAKLTASDSAANGFFGRSVAISGGTVVASGHGDDVSGSAYVFVKPASGWAVMTQTAKLTASDAAAGDGFAWDVAVSGDTVVVGAFFDDIGPNADQGSAYVFVKPGGGWGDMTQTAKLTASDGLANNWFGMAITVSGDTVVVGARETTYGIGDRGFAYVFVKPGSEWADMTQTAKLTASDGSGGDFFGRSLAASGDTVVVGAWGDDFGSPDSSEGSAYVFVKPGGGWANMTQTGKLTASDRRSGDKFGWSVAVSGDTVVVGAVSDDMGPNTDQGSAYVFVKPSGGWSNMTQTDKLTASDGAYEDYFGVSVAVSGDTVVGGAYSDDIGPNRNQGSAYVYTCSQWALGALDGDGDGVADCVDNCPGVANANQQNSDTDSHGDACDNCDNVANENQQNSDRDSLGDACDNCPNADNENQANADGDLHGDACDICPGFNDALDNDGDGTPDGCDGCPDDQNKTEPLICGCGVAETGDSDGDGVSDCVDQCPGVDDAVFAPGCVGQIPTVSEWGLLVLALLLLVAGKVYFSGRRASGTLATSSPLS